MYWRLLTSKSSARSVYTVNILLLQDVFYCLPLKVFEHFLVSFKHGMLLTGEEGGKCALLILSTILSAVY